MSGSRTITISFEGQVVVITGGGSAFARDIARRSAGVNDLGGPVSGDGDETSAIFANPAVETIRAAGKSRS